MELGRRRTAGVWVWALWWGLCASLASADGPCITGPPGELLCTDLNLPALSDIRKLTLTSSTNCRVLIVATVPPVAVSNDTLVVSSTTTLETLVLQNTYFQSIDIAQSQLAHIDLSHNSLENFTQISFRLDQLKSLNLSSNLLLSVSNFTSSTLQNLDLSNNSIDSLLLGECRELRVLNVSGNSIREVDGQSFEGLEKLEILILSYNDIEIISKETFRGINSLLRLELQGNKISKLEAGCFTGLTRLQYLDVSDNRLEALSPATMQDLPALAQLVVSSNFGLKKDLGLVLATSTLHRVVAAATGQKRIPSSLTRSVRTLGLAGNIISIIECGDLDSYPLLSHLDLSANNLSHIEDDALGRLELLGYLDLSKNMLSSVPRTLPGNLTTLLLGSNAVAHISQSDFMGLANLVMLDLSHNNIVNVSDSVFFPLKSLHSLNLSGNPITMLSIGALTGLNRLIELDLSWLTEVAPCAQSMCFPVPEANRLQSISVRGSPVLSKRLLSDAAALRALKQLSSLDLTSSGVVVIRDDLVYLLPHLTDIKLGNNPLNCTALQWLHDWLGKPKLGSCISEVHATTIAPVITDNPSTTELQTTTETTTTTSEPPTTASFAPTSTQTDKIITLIPNTETTMMPPTEYDILTNEVWDNSSAPGAVFAFATDTRTSHPGLFILLLLPVALVSAVLVLNYGRRPTIPPPAAIEISDFTSDLW